jgi:hypothetical protein
MEGKRCLCALWCHVWHFLERWVTFDGRPASAGLLYQRKIFYCDTRVSLYRYIFGCVIRFPPKIYMK